MLLLACNEHDCAACVLQHRMYAAGWSGPGMHLSRQRGAMQEAAATAQQVAEMRTAVAGLQETLVATFGLQSVEFAAGSGGVGSAEDLRQQHAALSNLQVRTHRCAS